MKRCFIFVWITILSVFSGFAAESDLSMESLLPSNTDVFLRSISIDRLISVIDDYKNSGVLSNSFRLIKQLAIIKEKTGIDMLDKSSLQKEGMDLSRGFGFAYINEYDPHIKIIDSNKRQKAPTREEYFFLVPVSNAGKFSQFFTNMLLKMDTGRKRDLYPAPIPYKNFKINQIEKDIFTTSINNYFIICSSGESVRSIIDRGLEGKNTLAAEPVYLSGRQMNNHKHDISLFIRGSFAAQKANRKQTGLVKSFGALDYIFINAAMEKNNLSLNLRGSFEKDNKTTNDFLNIFKTGLTDKALYDRDSVLYSFYSIDLNRLDRFLQGSFLKETYDKTVKRFGDDYGINLRYDVYPNSYGVINIFLNDYAKSEKIIFMPMIDSSKCLQMYDKIQAHLKNKYKSEEFFGYETFDSSRKAVYFFDTNGIKQYVFCDERGWYLGNSLPLLITVINKPLIGHTDKKNAILQGIYDDMSVFSKMQNDPVIPVSVKLGRGDKTRTLSMLNIRGISYSVKKNDTYILADADITFSRQKN